MPKNPCRSLLLTAAFIVWACLASTSTAADRSPNVVLVFVDDLGYGDLSCYGAEGWKTPNLDRVAKEGVKFTDFYVAQAVCSASRAALLTGCYANRVGINGALGPSSRIGISDKETTLGNMFQSKGYATGIVGKWHLGHLPPFLPTRHGFDQYFGLPYSNDMWPHHPEAKPGTYPPLPLYENEKIINPNMTGDDQSKLTEQYTERAVEFITKNQNSPFFLYVAHTFPHVPLYVGKKFAGSSQDGLLGDVIQELDWSCGEILNTLKKLDLDDNTLFIFISDNGPWLSYGNHAGTAGPLREGKGTAWDGGVRVPCLARWPGQIPAGKEQTEPAMTIDILPTLAELIGAKLPDHPIDGKNIWPLFQCRPGAKSPQEAYYFYYKVNELHAVRSGRWKMVLDHTYRRMDGQKPGKDGIPGKYRMEKAGLALYDLQDDLAERYNLAEQKPEIVERLNTYVEKARADLGDSLTKNPGKNRRPPGRVDP